MNSNEVPLITYKGTRLSYREYRTSPVTAGSTDTRQIFFRPLDSSPNFEAPEDGDLPVLGYYQLSLHLEIILERIHNPDSGIFQSKVSFKLDDETYAVVEHDRTDPERLYVSIQSSDSLETPFFIAEYYKTFLQRFSILGDSPNNIDLPEDFDEENADYEELDEQMTLNSSVVSIADVRMIPIPQIELFENEKVKADIKHGKRPRPEAYKKAPLKNNGEYQIGMDTYFFGFNRDQKTMRITVTRGETHKIKIIELPFAISPDMMDQIADVEDFSWASWNLWNLLKYELQAEEDFD